ncbi:MAG: carbon starvation protein A [Anaerolineae bacterium]|nr:carbon starvation protein A [Phycisphaerae bacterium]
MHAMPVMIVVLCCLAIAYRYYSAFIAAKVATLDDSRITPAVAMDDGQNFHPTNKWVLFGHHFAAISGAGPLIGPVLAAQFGYLPGLMWIVIGVCLAGAVQDFLVLVASTRRGGSSLAQIAFKDIGKVAGTAATVAILFIIVIALAGLGKVVVKALGGETISYPANSYVEFPDDASVPRADSNGIVTIPRDTKLQWISSSGVMQSMIFSDSFKLKVPSGTALTAQANPYSGRPGFSIPNGSVRLVPGSSWGTFTIACTIPIALLVGLYMYKIRPGHVVEASVIGGVLTLGATVLGGYVANSSIAPWFNLSAMGVTWSMAIYGFVASVLPVWILLCPRDYLSSFLKIGTIALLVVGVLIANPKLEAPPINHAFLNGGPVLGATAKIFPFLFITVMCGAISGFHALVSSGTTPKMIKRESDARTIGYGAMLIEGLVGVVAMIAAATLPMGDYFAMNTALEKVPAFHDQFVKIGAHIDNLNVYESLTQESLRGRTGGAVTLAVGMAHIFDGAIRRFSGASAEALGAMWKYWYHFAIMFEALFILTTIDTGTRIGRFLLQEVAGHAHPKLGIRGGMLSAIVSTGLIVFGWAWFMNSDSFDTIWRMFGVANQMLAVIALAIVSAFLFNTGRSKYLWVTLVPMAIVLTTTTTAAVYMLSGQIDGITTQLQKESAGRNTKLLLNSIMQAGAIVIVFGCGLTVVIAAAARVLGISKDNRQDAKSSKGGGEEPKEI